MAVMVASTNQFEKIRGVRLCHNLNFIICELSSDGSFVLRSLIFELRVLALKQFWKYFSGCSFILATTDLILCHLGKQLALLDVFIYPLCFPPSHPTTTDMMNKQSNLLLIYTEPQIWFEINLFPVRASVTKSHAS